MKKYLNFLMLLPFAALFAACDLGDSEPVGKYAFDTNAEQILIEAKLPTGTYDADEIYIAGPFNGAEAESYVADEKWRLTQSAVNINIYGVYLDPTAFVEGTSLADGFWLYSKNSGLSLTTDKHLATFTSSAEAGQRTNILISQWGEPVKEELAPTLPEHPGTIRVYVDNQAGWEAVALYQWGAENNLGGSWPGAQPTGTEVIADVEYIYFEYAIEDVEGKGQNLIFNNNGGGVQTADMPLTFSADVVDHFYVISGEKDCEAIENPLKPVIKMPVHEGFIRVYVDDQTTWTGMFCYQYGTVNNLGGGWPGMEFTGTETIGDVEYKYFEYAVEEVDGNEQHLIFNSGDGTQIPGENEPVITFSADVPDHAFLVLDDLSCIAIDPTDRSADEVPAE
ncbi:MAG: starch-binding protein [Bacteroidales bacterium]|nr:starch-binding protein [Bacteroidales bacterium]